MYVPLIVDEKDDKWKLVKRILSIFDLRRTKQEMSKQGITPVNKGSYILKTVLLSMLFSLEISYAIEELKKREKLRNYLNIPSPPSKTQVYSFLSRFSPEDFLNMVLGLLNSICSPRRGRLALILIDSTDIQVNINWFKKKITKKDLEHREFKWGYSSSHGYYIGYKLTMALNKKNMKPLAFLLHEGSPHDSKLFEPILSELKRRRVIRTGDIVIFDKGYYSYENYVVGITKYKIVPLIFPKKRFSLKKLLGMIGYPLHIFFKKGLKKAKDIYKAILTKFLNLIDKWKSFKPVRSYIEDVFKVVKGTSPYKKIHRFTKKSVKKFMSLSVLLTGILISMGFQSKEELQRLSEW